MLTKLILIRHGITHWNRQKRYCGHKDVPLNSEGKSQAKKLRQRFESINFDKVYSSDKKRAVQTAKIIFDGVKITKVKDLRELNFGALEGLSYKEIMKEYPVAYKKWITDPFKNSIPGVEGINSFKKRVNSAFERIVRLNPGKAVAVVCHGGTIGIFITSILKNRDFWHYIPDTASISIVEYKKDKPRIELFNETAHLR